MRRLTLLLATIAFSLALVFATPAVAFASPATNQTTNANSGNFICAPTSQQSANAASSTQNLLPINRWGGVSGSEFTYLPGGLTGTVGSLPHQTSRAIIGVGLSLGNALWNATSSLSTIAEQFCFGQQAGYEANTITAAIWHFATQTDILAFLAIAAIVVLIWRARKGQGIMKGLIRTMVLVIVIAALGISSSLPAHNGDPPIPSPAWIVTTAYSAITAVVGAPLAGINKLTSGVQLTGDSTSKTPSGLSCPSYINALLSQYTAAYGNNPAAKSAATVPEMVNDIWDSSGLQATAVAQFGDNGYTDQVYCHLYEEEAGIPPAAQLAIARRAGPLPAGATANSLAFLPAGAPSSEVVASIVGWAACTEPGSNQVKPNSGWANLTEKVAPGTVQQIAGGGLGAALGAITGGATLGATGVGGVQSATISQTDCTDWITEPVSSFNYANTGLAWGTSTTNIANSTQNAPQISDFLRNFFGDSSDGAFIITFVYVLASFAVLLVFGILSLAVIIAKFGLLLLMALFIIFLIVDLLPTRGGGNHSSKFLKQGLAFLLLAIGAEAVLGMVALLTDIIVRLGVGVTGNGIIGMLWIALSPIAAIWGVHHILKTFRIPSPFRPDAAMGWAAAAGAGGFLTGAIGEKIASSFNRVRSRGTGQARSTMRAGARRLAPSADKRAYAPREQPRKPPIKASRASTGGDHPSGGGPTPGGSPPTPGGGGRGGAPTPGGGSKVNSKGRADSGAASPATATATKSRVKRWLERPASEPTMINGQPYRTPKEMRLEGAQKLAAHRQQEKTAKQFIKSQQPAKLHHRVQAAMSHSGRMAYARFQADPKKAILRGAAYATVAALSPVSLPVTAGILGGHYALTKIRTAMAERPGAKAERRAHLDYVSRQIVPNLGAEEEASSQPQQPPSQPEQRPSRPQQRPDRPQQRPNRPQQRPRQTRKPPNANGKGGVVAKQRAREATNRSRQQNQRNRNRRRR